MRIAKALALAGIGSRRNCEEHIKNGAVTLNGEVVQDLGRQVNPDEDALAFRGRLLLFEKYVYYMLFKPEGYTTTAEDPHAKKTVYDLLPGNLVRSSRQPKMGRIRVFPVGRLDKNSAGLLLFTNDGELANRLMHPRYEVPKWYDIKLDPAVRPEDKVRLLKGVRLYDGMAKAFSLQNLSRRVVRLSMKEGKKREVRRMFEALGYEVLHLCRIAQGPLSLGNLLPGHGRYLTPHEIKQLKAL